MCEEKAVNIAFGYWNLPPSWGKYVIFTIVDYSLNVKNVYVK